jgi:hypothetical protein
MEFTAGGLGHAYLIGFRLLTVAVSSGLTGKFTVLDAFTVRAFCAAPAQLSWSQNPRMSFVRARAERARRSGLRVSSSGHPGHQSLKFFLRLAQRDLCFPALHRWHDKCLFCRAGGD